MKIYDNGHRLIPRVTHSEAELARHVARYEFCKRVIQKDVATRDYVSSSSAPIRVLDLGCGVGYGTVILASTPRVSVVGIDTSEESIQYAQIHYARSNVEYQVQDIIQFTETMRHGDWDYIVANEVIEHIEDGFTLLERLQFGRLVIVSTPYNEPMGVNPHHLLWNITERSCPDLGPIEFFFTDLQGIVYDKCHRPKRVINLIGVIHTPEACKAVRKIRDRIWFERSMDEIRNFVPEKWRQSKGFVHSVTAFVRSLTCR